MGQHWQKLNGLLQNLAHNYLLVTIGGALFFAVKAYIGYRTYKRYDRELRRIETKLNDICARIK